MDYGVVLVMKYILNRDNLKVMIIDMDHMVDWFAGKTFCSLLWRGLILFLRYDTF